MATKNVATSTTNKTTCPITRQQFRDHGGKATPVVTIASQGMVVSPKEFNQQREKLMPLAAEWHDLRQGCGGCGPVGATTRAAIRMVDLRGRWRRSCGGRGAVGYA